MQKKKRELLDRLYKKDKHICHYCHIREEDFLKLWGEFYGLQYRGRRLEIDRKDNVVVKGNIVKKINPDYTDKNCVLACALCNMSKSNMFTHDEFKKVAKVIEEIWRKRKMSGLNQLVKP